MRVRTSSEAGAHRGTVLFSFEGTDLELCDADLRSNTTGMPIA
jgi:hypothetical protein